MPDTLLFYDSHYFNFFKELNNQDGKDIISITEILQDNNKAHYIDDTSEIVDITAFSALKDIQYHAELILPKFPVGTIFIASSNRKELFEHEMRFCFSQFEQVDVEESFNESGKGDIVVGSEKLKHKKLIDLTQDELSEFGSIFREQLYGHEKFKDEFTNLIRNFRIFNKLGEHKILSLFLMGGSGVGKTEVARAIHKALKGQRKLAKVNFGNYSSDNSLNSLIGSPRGYIGSDEGEIFIRVKESDIGLILIDEFEKSNATLFNYFLDVLENGKMISSLAEEIDLSGFIMIFTSNITKEDFFKKISPELRSRFDYKGFFTLLHRTDKEKFVQFRIDSIITKFNQSYNKIELPIDIGEKIFEKIHVGKFNNMRDLNKNIKDTFVNCVMNYLNQTPNNS